ncbi:MAG: head-tail connector protein [Bacillus sp. (in: firmicutes)]
MFIEVSEIKKQTSFTDLKSLSDQEIQRYIERADAWIRRATGRDYSESTAEGLRQDMKVATLLLVEYLWYWDDPETKETGFSDDETVRIGSFSYSKKPDESGYKTGIPELDMILEYWRQARRPGLGLLFRVSGPSDEVR